MESLWLVVSAQWLEHWSMESEGLRFDSSSGLRIFFFVPCLWQRWKKHPSLFLYQAQSLPSLNSIYKHYAIDIADPSGMQEACDLEHQSSESEGLRFDSSWRLRSFFLCPTLMTRWKKKHISLILRMLSHMN